jgi:hypothetical protein
MEGGYSLRTHCLRFNYEIENLNHEKSRVQFPPNIRRGLLNLSFEAHGWNSAITMELFVVP